MIEAFGLGLKEESDPLFWLIAPFVSACDTKSTQYQLVIKASETDRGEELPRSKC